MATFTPVDLPLRNWIKQQQSILARFSRIQPVIAIISLFAIGLYGRVCLWLTEILRARPEENPSICMKTRRSIIGIALFMAFLCASVLKAQDGLGGALSRSLQDPHALYERSPQLAAADFDNDQKPDGAVLVEAGLLDGKRAFRIELHVTASSNNTITFSSTESRLVLSALDVNRDGAPDIVVEKAFTHERLQVYLNDGHGTFYGARAEDYPTQDPSAPGWRANLSQAPPAFCLPVTRNPAPVALRQISKFPRELSGTSRPRHECLLARLAVRAPSSSRAPPSLLSL